MPTLHYFHQLSPAQRARASSLTANGTPEAQCYVVGAAAQTNSEDAVIEWNDLAGAADFEQHFQSRLASCRPI
jgi:hypothetical protein